MLFFTFVVVALVGRATGQRTMWKVAYPAPSVCAMALVLCFWCRPGVRCAKYGAGVLLGLVWTLLSDVFVVEEPELQLFYLAFLCSMVGVFCFTYSFWAPSVPTSRLADANVDTSRSASACAAWRMRLPVPPSRVGPPCCPCAAPACQAIPGATLTPHCYCVRCARCCELGGSTSPALPAGAYPGTRWGGSGCLAHRRVEGHAAGHSYRSVPRGPRVSTTAACLGRSGLGIGVGVHP